MSLKHFFYTLSLILWTLTQISAQNLPELPQALIDYMASREMRYHHFLWHNIRNLWLAFDEDTQKAIRELGWEPPRPSLRYNQQGRAILIDNNDSGEDFFYMHRQMVEKANQIISEQRRRYSRVSGFREIPSPTSSSYPVPPAYETPDSDSTQTIKDLKSDQYYWDRIKPQEDWFKDPDNLRSMTLGEFGANLEFTVHNMLHTRFSEKPIGFRPGSAEAIPNIDKRWDDPAYDWMGDSYASQVNPWFWKIHGWVDDRIKDWQEANNVERIEWKGRWVGGPLKSLSQVVGDDVAGLDIEPQEVSEMEHFHGQHSSSLSVMEKVAQIVLKTGMETNFFDHVQTKMDSLSISNS